VPASSPFDAGCNVASGPDATDPLRTVDSAG